MGICESMDRSKAESLIASEVVLDSFPYNLPIYILECLMWACMYYFYTRDVLSQLRSMLAGRRLGIG